LSGSTQLASGSACRYSHSQPYGQHPRAKNRQKYFIPVVFARVRPASRRILQRVWDLVLLERSQRMLFHHKAISTDFEYESSRSPPAHLLYQMSVKSMSMPASIPKLNHALYSLPV
jgi:hypothetical protein